MGGSSFKSKVCGERKEFSDRLLKQLNGQLHIDIFDFPELTKAYLGLCSQPFDNVLRSTPRVSIDLADDLGKTTLHWASEAGDWEAVEQLIRRGADPDKPNCVGRSALHSSVYMGSRCLELLLRANCDVDMKDIDGQTALHLLSAYGLDTTNLDLLVSFGVNIEAMEFFGQTPLFLAVMENNHLMVSGLLERGANINARTLAGWTCLFEALCFGSHNSLRILLDNIGLCYSVKLDKGWTLLHVAAFYADIKALYILMSKQLYRLDPAEEDVNGLAAMQFAHFRKLNNEKWSTIAGKPRDKDPIEWYYAFEELLESITEAQALMAGYCYDEVSKEEAANSDFPLDASDEDPINDDQDDEELWEDAQEDLDGNFQT